MLVNLILALLVVLLLLVIMDYLNVGGREKTIIVLVFAVILLLWVTGAI